MLLRDLVTNILKTPAVYNEHGVLREQEVIIKMYGEELHIEDIYCNGAGEFVIVTEFIGDKK
jgi:hypothetical protein